ncbi:MAG: hypothetical protein ACRCWQ_03250 [Bacilli bacterium]
MNKGIVSAIVSASLVFGHLNVYALSVESKQVAFQQESGWSIEVLKEVKQFDLDYKEMVINQTYSLGFWKEEFSNILKKLQQKPNEQKNIALVTKTIQQIEQQTAFAEAYFKTLYNTPLTQKYTVEYFEDDVYIVDYSENEMARYKQFESKMQRNERLWNKVLQKFNTYDDISSDYTVIDPKLWTADDIAMVNEFVKLLSESMIEEKKQTEVYISLLDEYREKLASIRFENQLVYSLITSELEEITGEFTSLNKSYDTKLAFLKSKKPEQLLHVISFEKGEDYRSVSYSKETMNVLYGESTYAPFQHLSVFVEYIRKTDMTFGVDFSKAFPRPMPILYEKTVNTKEK